MLSLPCFALLYAVSAVNTLISALNFHRHLLTNTHSPPKTTNYDITHSYISSTPIARTKCPKRRPCSPCDLSSAASPEPKLHVISSRLRQSSNEPHSPRRHGLQQLEQDSARHHGRIHSNIAPTAAKPSTTNASAQHATTSNAGPPVPPSTTKSPVSEPQEEDSTS